MPEGGSYLLAKYTDTNMSSVVSLKETAKVGLLRMGELMSGNREKEYWTLTMADSYNDYYINTDGKALYKQAYENSGVRPVMNLKSNVVITGGSGTKEDPFTVALNS